MKKETLKRNWILHYIKPEFLYLPREAEEEDPIIIPDLEGYVWRIKLNFYLENAPEWLPCSITYLLRKKQIDYSQSLIFYNASFSKRTVIIHGIEKEMWVGLCDENIVQTPTSIEEIESSLIINTLPENLKNNASLEVILCARKKAKIQFHDFQGNNVAVTNSYIELPELSKTKTIEYNLNYNTGYIDIASTGLRDTYTIEERNYKGNVRSSDTYSETGYITQNFSQIMPLSGGAAAPVHTEYSESYCLWNFLMRNSCGLQNFSFSYETQEQLKSLGNQSWGAEISDNYEVYSENIKKISTDWSYGSVQYHMLNSFGDFQTETAQEILQPLPYPNYKLTYDYIQYYLNQLQFKLYLKINEDINSNYPIQIIYDIKNSIQKNIITYDSVTLDYQYQIKNITPPSWTSSAEIPDPEYFIIDTQWEPRRGEYSDKPESMGSFTRVIKDGEWGNQTSISADLLESKVTAEEKSFSPHTIVLQYSLDSLLNYEVWGQNYAPPFAPVYAINYINNPVINFKEPSYISTEHPSTTETTESSIWREAYFTYGLYTLRSSTSSEIPSTGISRLVNRIAYLFRTYYNALSSNCIFLSYDNRWTYNNIVYHNGVLFFDNIYEDDWETDWRSSHADTFEPPSNAIQDRCIRYFINTQIKITNDLIN